MFEKCASKMLHALKDRAKLSCLDDLINLLISILNLQKQCRPIQDTRVSAVKQQ